MNDNKYIPSFAVRGRGLKPDKKSLVNKILDERSAVANCSMIFNQRKKIHLELGFGDGDHLISRAASQKNDIFIGCEVYKRGILKVASHIEENKLHNIYLYEGDGRILLESIEEQSVNKIYILFPDPWPKSKHHKRRLINKDSLLLFYKKLEVGGTLHIATDCKDYAQQIFASADKSIWQIESSNKRPTDWVETKYEKQAIDAQREIFYISMFNPTLQL